MVVGRGLICESKVSSETTQLYAIFALALYGAKSYPERHYRDTRTGVASGESVLWMFSATVDRQGRKSRVFHKHTVEAVSWPQPPYRGLVISAKICNVLRTFGPR